MMTNVYPFLVGMAALAHEKIDKFPDIDDPDNHALAVHCGYFGLVARQFCTEWTLSPNCIIIANDDYFEINMEKKLPEEVKSDIMGVNENGRLASVICLEIWRKDL